MSDRDIPSEWIAYVDRQLSVLRDSLIRLSSDLAEHLQWHRSALEDQVRIMHATIRWAIALVITSVVTVATAVVTMLAAR